jgi:hypothetical protein
MRQCITGGRHDTRLLARGHRRVEERVRRGACANHAATASEQERSSGGNAISHDAVVTRVQPSAGVQEHIQALKSA